MPEGFFVLPCEPQALLEGEQGKTKNRFSSSEKQVCVSGVQTINFPIKFHLKKVRFTVPF